LGKRRASAKVTNATPAVTTLFSAHRRRETLYPQTREKLCELANALINISIVARARLRRHPASSRLKKISGILRHVIVM
jgi:hypothetical protein